MLAIGLTHGHQRQDLISDLASHYSGRVSRPRELVNERRLTGEHTELPAESPSCRCRVSLLQSVEYTLVTCPIFQDHLTQIVLAPVLLTPPANVTNVPPIPSRPRESQMTSPLFLLVILVLLLPIDLPAEPLPDFRGRHLSEIRANTKLAHITLKTEKVDSPQRRGEILLQKPGPESNISSTTHMYLTVSDGIVVPSLVGLPESHALAKLNALGIRAYTTRRPQPRVRNGAVAAQIPIPHTRLDVPRMVVFLIVSNDPRITIPNVTSMDSKAALETLKRIGLVGEIDYKRVSTGVFSGSYDCRGGTPILWAKPHEHRTFVTSPPVGALVEPGTNVILHITFYYEESPHCSSEDYGSRRRGLWSNLPPGRIE